VFYNVDQPAKPRDAVKLKLSGLHRGRYHLVACRVGYRSNDVQSAWRDLGSPSQLSRDQVALLRRASAGAPAIDEEIEINATGGFASDFKMCENDVWLVVLQRRRN